MPEVMDEDLLTTAAAARDLNRRVADAKFSPTVIWRWMRDGSLAADGERIFLEHARLGRKLVTSRQAMARFAARLAQRRSPEQPQSEVRADAKAELTANGFFD